MSDSKGLYAVPENIRKMKPRGTMVKKIKGHYYVYRMQHIKDEKTGKWKIKSLGIIGKIVEEEALSRTQMMSRPFVNTGRTAFSRNVRLTSEHCFSRHSAMAMMP